jgi:hypothetical protein
MYSIYRAPPTTDLLGQGDILEPEPLRSTLSGHQDYFVGNPNFYRYMILTQSCDLERGRQRAEFIFVGVVRRLRDVLTWRHVENKEARKKTNKVLSNLYIHGYNKRGLFYLPQDADYGIEEESVADLRVMFCLHKACYPDLLRARRGAITDLYAAQLGHMVGHMFSRVAMPGWEQINPDVTLGGHTDSVVKSIQCSEEQILLELLKNAEDVCFVPDCRERATTYRWLPVEKVNDQWRYERRVLCAGHAKQYEESRAGEIEV